MRDAGEAEFMAILRSLTQIVRERSLESSDRRAYARSSDNSKERADERDNYTPIGECSNGDRSIHADGDIINIIEQTVACLLS